MTFEPSGWHLNQTADNAIQLIFHNLFSRELHLSHNMLRNLPYELGKLFHLVLLGLHGNPLTKDILSIYNDINGTNKLLTHMLDSYSREYQKTNYFRYDWHGSRLGLPNSPQVVLIAPNLLWTRSCMAANHKLIKKSSFCGSTVLKTWLTAS